VRQSRQGGATPRAPQGTLSLRSVEVVRTYLALESPAQLRPASADVPGARVVRHAPCSVDVYRRLYRDVGETWFWHERLKWTDDELREHLEHPSVAVWELFVDDESAGYFELYRHDDGSVELDYFGLTPRFIGRGLGGWLLTRAVQEAHALGARRVWLHTCTLDSPNALPAYKARGFREFKTERLLVEIDGSHVVSERMLHD
jgi:GNAT superfamily N-acetyltransferase